MSTADAAPKNTSATTLSVHVRATRYTVSCLPVDHPAARHYRVFLLEFAPGQWMVASPFDDEIFDIDGQRCWHKPNPLEDREAWKARHHFDFDTAVEVAAKAAQSLEVNGRSVADVLAQSEERAS